MKKKEEPKEDLKEENINASYLVEQSWRLTKLKYDITKVEKNIFLKIVELCQKYERGQQLEKDCSLEMIIGKMSGKESPEITFPIKDLVGNSHNSYECYKIGLGNLATRPFHMPDDKWDFTQINLFEKVQGSEKKGIFKVKMTETFWELFHDRQIFKKIDTAVSYRFKSVFSSRMYELLVGNKKIIYYDIDNIISLLGKESYTPAAFLMRVIKVAEQELMESENCPFYFETDVVRKGDKLDKEGQSIEREKRKLNPKKGGKIEKLGFIVIHKTNVVSPETDKRNNKAVGSVEEKVLPTENPAVVLDNTLDENIRMMTGILFGKDVFSSEIDNLLLLLQNKIGVEALVTKLSEIKLASSKTTLKKGLGHYLNGSLKNIYNSVVEKEASVNVIKKSAETVTAIEVKSSVSEVDEGVYDIEALKRKAGLAGVDVNKLIEMMDLVKVDDNKYRTK